MDPIAALMALWAISDRQTGNRAVTPGTPAPAVSTLPAYSIPFYGMLVIQLSDTNKLVLMDKVNTGFVTDGTKVLNLRYGAADKAQQGIAWLKEGKPQSPLKAQYYTAFAAIVVRGPGLATVVIDNTNIGTVDDTGKFFATALQGTRETVSALISKLLAAGADLSKMASSVTLGEALSWLDGRHTGHHRRAHHGTPRGYHRAKHVLHLFR